MSPVRPGLVPWNVAHCLPPIATDVFSVADDDLLLRPCVSGSSAGLVCVSIPSAATSARCSKSLPASLLDLRLINAPPTFARSSSRLLRCQPGALQAAPPSPLAPLDDPQCCRALRSPQRVGWGRALQRSSCSVEVRGQAVRLRCLLLVKAFRPFRVAFCLNQLPSPTAY